jgi:two-component system sensor histidine kinase FlrB
MSLRKLERLVDEMLLFARGGQLAVEPVAARELLAAVESAAREAFSVSGFELEFAPLDDAGRVYVNSAALISVCLNLIDNACHACRAQGRMTVTAGVIDGKLCLAFQDNGPGITSEQAAQIFEPFFTTRANGTGLGLAVARAVTQAHGGELTLVAGHGQGACFLMTLPLIGSQSAAQDSPVTLETHAVSAYAPADLRQAG